MGLKVNYGLLDGTTVDLAIPYQSIEVDDIGLQQSGLADIELGVNQRVMSGRSKVWFSGGVALPTGVSDAQDQDGRNAHASLQLGRGAVDCLLSLKGMHTLSENAVLYGDFTSRWGLGENDVDYQHGTVIDATVGGSYAWASLDIFGHLLWESAEADRRGGTAVHDTGGDVAYFTAGIRYWLTDNSAFTLRNRFLVGDDVNGEQMLPRHTFGVGLTVLLGP